MPDSLKSARATMETFLSAMNSGNAAEARSTLDLTGFGTILQESEGDRLAAALWDVINRTQYVELDKLPVRETGEPYVFYRYNGGEYSITIAPQEDGAWRFTSETVSQIDAMFAYVREQGWDVKTDPTTGQSLREVDLMQANPSLWLKQRVPDSWHRTYMGIELYNFLGVLALFAVAFVAGFAIRWITKLIVRSSLHIDEEIADKRQIKSLGRALSLNVNVAMIGFGLPFLELPYYVTSPTLFVLKLLNAFAWFWLLGVVWDVFVAVVARRASERSRSTHKVVVPVVSKFGRFIIFVGVLIFFVAGLGYDVRALLAGLGIGGLVFALAAKDSVENLFGSVTILMEMPFGVGDWVKIGDIDGEVEEINLRSTRIRTFADSLITMPNSRMITSHVENFGARRHRRLSTTLGIAYDTPPKTIEEFCARLRKMLAEDPNVWNEKRFVYFNNLGDSTLNVMLYCFIIAPTWQLELEYRDAVLRKVLAIAEEMGVEFAFPTRKIIHANEPVHGAAD